MDIRGIEVTNQLRSAIRAKLLELGVRYDEELPDYILVMVVNKKTRQQMHEDLHLFLEDSTVPFVEWLHDQVLKKLQKVTIAKKKAPREFVPSVIVKQEEERKKRKLTATTEIPPGIILKEEKPIPLPPLPLAPVEPEKIPEKVPEKTPPRPASPAPSPDLSPPPKMPPKRPAELPSTPERPEKRVRPPASSPAPSAPDDEDPEEENEKRLKSCVAKPKITSVVSVKNRLGLISPRKKFENHRSRDRRFDVDRRRDDDNFLRNRNDLRNRQGALERNREGRNREERFTKNLEIGEKASNWRSRNLEEPAAAVKHRLGIVNKNLGQKSLPIEEATTRSVKNRLGPMRVVNSHANFVPTGSKRNLGRKEETGGNNVEDDEDGDIVGPVKSHIIAVKRKDIVEKTKNKIEDEDEDDGKSIASKVIVTPRPLKPLQPTQKRATQSLLLRAVAEANQSVVKQKNPEPALSDKKPKPMRLKQLGARETIGKNLSIHLNKTKRLVMENIQVQLRTAEDEDKDKTYSPRPDNDEHMGVVMSLFQRSDDNQKFLVTLNGYNNNVITEKNLSDEEEERLEMEVTEDDEILLSTAQNESYEQSETSTTPTPPIELEEPNETVEKIDENKDENDENHNGEIVELLEEEAPQRTKRKLSPIVYRSSSPTGLSVDTLSLQVKSVVEKRPIVETTGDNKTRDKCRYWPNCTLGSKCAYYHPAVPCSLFPSCKFGDKCAYKHPNCKFGLSCTKVGCVFSHPKQQCKYHPFCTKALCPYSHPPIHTPVPSTPDIARAKFTWKRRD